MHNHNEENSSATSGLAIIFGSRTTLAKHLLSGKWAKQHNLLLVARDQSEAGYLASNFPTAAVLPCWLPQNQWKWPETHGGVKIFLCAFGVIHPDAPDWPGHCKTMNRDIEVLARILQNFRGQSVKLVFISSVLALMPKPGRNYYAGFKCLSEAMISELAKKDEISLSVLYPGRLVEQKNILKPLSFCHTTYERFAQRLTQAANSQTRHRKITGLDARGVLLLRAMCLFMHAIFK